MGPVLRFGVSGRANNPRVAQMQYLGYGAVATLLFAMLFLVAGVVGRGWFLWPRGDSEKRP